MFELGELLHNICNFTAMLSLYEVRGSWCPVGSTKLIH